MTQIVRAPVLTPGLATGIGSLPHTDPVRAAEVVLRLLPDLPAAPQLPERDPREGMIAQWLGALPEVVVADDGSCTLRGRSDDEPHCIVDPVAHAGLLVFLDVAAGASAGGSSTAVVQPARVKVQLTGPLTLGSALEALGVPTARAYKRAAVLCRAWVATIEQLVAKRLPGTDVVVFLDEPALVRWRRGDAALDRDSAIDVLSGALAAVEGVTGVHVCGDGDLGLAIEAGPQVLGIEVRDDLTEAALPLSRFLDGEGWVAWGAIPTDRPVGESPDPHWRHLASVWCELARRGCDPVVMRTRGLVTPACGLAGYGASQAERVLGIAHELAGRVHDQAVAARLTLGA
jgi:hypothetical protein